jgi:hypothetical protein
MSFPLNFALVQDLVLLLASGVACLYCLLLNRKLKGLNSLKTGVGASIVSLTNAIKDTHQAAKMAQTSTVESIETLNALLTRAEEASTKVEADTVALERVIRKATDLHSKLTPELETKLPHAIGKAQNTASSLLKVVADIEKYRRLAAFKAAADLSTFFETEQDGTTSELLPQLESHLSVVATKPDADATEKPILETIETLNTLIDSAASAEMSAHIETVQTLDTELKETSIESGDTHKDPIDALFDNIDALVQKKGVQDNRMGFLQSRKYSKS